MTIGKYYGATVTVNKMVDGSFAATCNCWDFQYGHTCSHCVAAIYAVEAKTEHRPATTPSSGKRMQPYHRVKNADDYHYYDLEKISKNIYMDEGMFQEAERMIDAGEIVKVSINMFSYHTADFTNYTGLRIVASMKQSGETVEVSVGKDFFWKCNCNFRRCYYSHDLSYYRDKIGSYKVCKHVTAAFLMLVGYIEDENPGDETDYRAKQLLGRVLRRNNSSAEKAEKVTLTPELQNKNGELSAGFKIALDKSYKVKNLTELAEKAEENGTLTLGKNGAINFALYDFDEASKGFYALIQSAVRDNQQRAERLHARIGWGYSDKYFGEKIGDTLLLEGSKLDEFYRLCENLPEIEYGQKDFAGYGSRSTGKKNKGKLRCAEGMPEIDLKLEEVKDGQQTSGVKLSGNLPSVTQGNNGLYYANEDGFFRVPAEDAEQLKLLYDLADNNGMIECTIGRRHFGEFYQEVYPLLRKIAKVNDMATNKVAKYIPPKAEVTFYLDSIGRTLTCRAEAHYDEKLHSPMEAADKRGFSETYRDFSREKQVCEAITTYFPEYDEVKDESYCEDGEASYRVYREGVDALLQLGEVKCTDRFQSRNLRKKLGIKVGVSIESDILNLDITSSDLSREELMEVFESYRLKRKFHVLKNGDFVDLESQDIELIDQILRAGNAQMKELLGDKIKIPAYRAIYLDKLFEDHEELYGNRDRNFRKLIKDFGTIKDSEIEVPESLANRLRNYQVYGHKWLRMLAQYGFGGILADEMGLGKTLQMISVLLAEKQTSEKTSLIVCPASLVYNWKEEFRRFAPELKVEAVAGGVGERRKQIRNYKDVDVLVTSYDLLKRDIAEYEQCNFEYQILDEAQYIKNQKSVASKTVKVIRAVHRFALTGTPIENRLSELWSIFDYLMPGFLYDYETFRRELETPIVKDKDTVASARLKKMVGPFILRRLKGDVLKDLPEKLEEIRYGVMEEKQRQLYDAQVQRITQKVAEENEEEFKRGKLEILAELTRTRQLCCDPSLVVENYKGASAKREACVELVQSAIEGEHGILIFSQFTSMLDLLAADLREAGIPFYVLTGDTPKEERIRLMNSFNEGAVPVFLISLRAGGTGLNLTGADIVIHYDPWWNLAVQNQATDRAHRIGQTKTVTVYKLIIKGSIEEKIVQLQDSKKNLADEILSGESSSLASLSKEDLLELLS
ncbi:MAG: DEAD/DEAH box helicase [Acetatifactor sp.]|nr:DEAD/DEAH box helicase [Acetatifactor sp.]